MSSRRVKLHAFASTKGGVGKSTFAVAAAHWLAGEVRSRVPVVIDLDLTGSSLADGLDLVAPNLRCDGDGRFLPAAQAEALLSYQETRARRFARASKSTGGSFLQLPYSNDALLARESTGVGSWIWRDTENSKIGYLPSSSITQDIERAARDLVEMPGKDWRDALIATIVEIVEYDSGVTDVILDLPPGTWGFAHTALAALGALKSSGHHGIEWSTNAILVTSPDKTTLVPTLEYAVRSAARLSPPIKPVVNRSTETPELIRARANAALAPAIAKLKPENLLAFVDESRELNAVFRGRAPASTLSFAETLRLE